VRLYSYHIFKIGVVREGEEGIASSFSYIQNKALLISYIQNRHSQRVTLHPDHIFIIGVVRGGGGFFLIIYSEGREFIHIIYSQ
jgi:hypothetical protein